MTTQGHRRSDIFVAILFVQAGAIALQVGCTNRPQASPPVTTNEPPSVLAIGRGPLVVMGSYTCDCLTTSSWYLNVLGDGRGQLVTSGSGLSDGKVTEVIISDGEIQEFRKLMHEQRFFELSKSEYGKVVHDPQIATIGIRVGRFTKAVTVREPWEWIGKSGDAEAIEVQRCLRLLQKIYSWVNDPNATDPFDGQSLEGNSPAEQKEM